ncbi:MAG: AbrB/MazE/SpoVT family DNA-binding domain-containing protein [Candidatus Sericytochromatia bacterium]|nr:AbrB/MazE/SpoVT family DNA-binding domain-containing protein [Candidatus Sericytochromatia bacterium]
MRITAKGQVTIPKHVRESLGLGVSAEVEFAEENGRFYLVKRSDASEKQNLQKFRGIASARLSTDDILSLTRAEA